MRTVYLPLAVPCVVAQDEVWLDCRTFGCPLLAAHEQVQDGLGVVLCGYRAIQACIDKTRPLVGGDAQVAA